MPSRRDPGRKRDMAWSRERDVGATGEQFGRDKRDLSSQCELGAGRIGS